MPTATITSKGQVTIPKEIRNLLHLKAGDRVDFRVDDEGRVIMEPATVDISELKGCLRRPGAKKISLERMNEVIKERTSEGYSRV